MIYIQAVLYLIKEHWRIIVTAMPALATVILELTYAYTSNEACYYCSVGTGLGTVLLWCIMHAPVISNAMDRLGLKITPEDEM